jgi:hypothetical protein
MKQYPSIPKLSNKTYPAMHNYVFDKLDGSLIRAEWNDKRGFYKFGTKHELIDTNSKPFGKAVKLVQDKYSEGIATICKDHKWKDIICFLEFHGTSSFAGQHNWNEEHDVTLFDVNPYKQGILPPAQFIEHFRSLGIPKVLWVGEYHPRLYDQVRDSTLQGMTHEGVVVKGVNNDSTPTPIMFKIKSQAWLDKLKEHCKGDEQLFERLS